MVIIIIISKTVYRYLHISIYRLNLFNDIMMVANVSSYTRNTLLYFMFLKIFYPPIQSPLPGILVNRQHHPGAAAHHPANIIIIIIMPSIYKMECSLLKIPFVYLKLKHRRQLVGTPPPHEHIQTQTTNSTLCVYVCCQQEAQSFAKYHDGKCK